MTGRIFDIQRFSLHDGPGIRTTVFFKGCNLHCYWCHNPESQSPENELQQYPAKCIGCGQCLLHCPKGALSSVAGVIQIDRSLCDGCGICADVCCAGALVLAGRTTTPSSVLDTVRRDRAFYEKSGGGATFSGGEPLYQHEFLVELLKLCRAEGISTAIETAGHVPWAWFEEVLDLTDLFLFDIKHADDARHRQGTGVGIELIRQNLEGLLSRKARVWVRIPVIPGFNADPADMGRIAGSLAHLQGIEKVELMPFHRLGTGKSESLGRPYAAEHLTQPARQELVELAALFSVKGLPIQAI